MNKWNLCGWAAFGTLMWVLSAKLTGVKKPISYGQWGFCRDVDAKALCAGRSQSSFKTTVCIEQVMFKVKPLCVKHQRRLYISSFQRSLFPFCINQLSQECLLNKLMITPAWNECRATWKRFDDAQGIELPCFLFYLNGIAGYVFFSRCNTPQFGSFFSIL